MDQFGQRLPAVPLGVLELLTERRRREAGEHHLVFRRRQPPARGNARWHMPAVARRAIGLAVARGAMQAGSALALGAAQYELVVDAALVTLRRLVALRVAIAQRGLWSTARTVSN